MTREQVIRSFLDGDLLDIEVQGDGISCLKGESQEENYLNITLTVREENCGGEKECPEVEITIRSGSPDIDEELAAQTLIKLIRKKLGA